MPATGDGLLGMYYNTYNLSTPAATRVDKTVDSYWKRTAPAAGVFGKQFAANWTGDVLAPKTGVYTISLVSNGWTRMWLNNKLVVDRARFGSGTSNFSVALTGGVVFFF